MSNSRSPFSFKGILDGGRKQILRLEREYQYWVFATISLGIAGIITLLAVLWLSFLDQTQDFLLLRILLSISSIINFSIMYFVLLETQRRRSHLLEVRHLMQSGLSFLDAIKQTFKRD